MDYGMSDGSTFMYLVIWVGVIFTAASTWHLWRYLDNGDEHSVIHAKASYISLAGLFGALISIGPTAFLLVLGIFLDSILGMTKFGLMEELGTMGIMVVFFACAQVGAGMYLLKDDHSWRDFLRKPEDHD